MGCYWEIRKGWYWESPRVKLMVRQMDSHLARLREHHWEMRWARQMDGKTDLSRELVLVGS